MKKIILFIILLTSTICYGQIDNDYYSVIADEMYLCQSSGDYKIKTIDSGWYNICYYQRWCFPYGTTDTNDIINIDTVLRVEPKDGFEIMKYILELERRIKELENKLLPSYDLGEPNKYWKEKGVDYYFLQLDSTIKIKNQ